MNNKLSSHRFLSPLATTDNAGKAVGAAAAATNLIPPSGIDKYPGAQQLDAPIGINKPPRGLRETKNNQLFEKYMNRNGAAGGGTVVGDRKQSLGVPGL